jgi:hypothetical protein
MSGLCYSSGMAAPGHTSIFSPRIDRRIAGHCAGRLFRTDGQLSHGEAGHRFERRALDTMDTSERCVGSEVDASARVVRDDWAGTA